MGKLPNNNHKTFLIFSLIAFTALAVLSLPASGHCRKQLPKRQKTTAVQILAINDFHGQITEGVSVDSRPVGSAPVLAAYLKESAKGQEKNTFFVHAGDVVGASTPESALLQDEPTIMFFNQMANRYCRARGRMHPKCNMVGTVGNHEFDEGQDELLRLIYGGNHEDGPFLQDPWQGARFPYVCANIIREDSGRSFLPPFVVKKINNVPIAFIGAVLEGTPSIVTASGIEGLAFTDEATAINRYVRYLKKRGVRTIIVLLHQGGSQTAYEGETDTVAADLSGEVVEIVENLDSEVDVVITGHSHGFSNILVENKEGAEILVTQSWSKGSAYADIDLTIDNRTRNVVTKTAQIITTWADEGAGLEPDAKVSALVEQAVAATEIYTSAVVGTTASALVRGNIYTAESALGNLIADAQRAQMGTDFAFMNPGGVRADLDAGEVTWGELYTIQPFNNYLVKMTLTGEQVYTLLNQQFLPHQNYTKVLQVSGLSYTWNASRPDGDKIVEVLQADGTPIDVDATYTVTVNSFLAGGGDNFSVLTEGSDQVIGPIDLDALIEYIQGLEQPFSASIEGRIVEVD
jgi:5'-nucleotidase